jgi:FKBP-type peptidyl-prolyl cis-trans isomerase 2
MTVNHSRVRPLKVGDPIFVEYVMEGSANTVERPAVVTEVYGRAIRVDFTNAKIGSGSWYAKCQIKHRKAGQ